MSAPQLPNDEIIRMMSKMAVEKATAYFADMADKFADDLPPNISGSDALKAFAEAIRSTNAKRFGGDAA